MCCMCPRPAFGRTFVRSLPPFVQTTKQKRRAICSMSLASTSDYTKQSRKQATRVVPSSGHAIKKKGLSFVSLRGLGFPWPSSPRRHCGVRRETRANGPKTRTRREERKVKTNTQLLHGRHSELTHKTAGSGAGPSLQEETDRQEGRQVTQPASPARPGAHNLTQNRE